MFRGQGDEEETEGGREQPERAGRKLKTVSGKAKEERRRDNDTDMDIDTYNSRALSSK